MYNKEMMKAMKYYLNCLVTCVTYPAAEAACEARRGPLLAGGPSCRHPGAAAAAVAGRKAAERRPAGAEHPALEVAPPHRARAPAQRRAAGARGPRVGAHRAGARARPAAAAAGAGRRPPALLYGREHSVSSC